MLRLLQSWEFLEAFTSRVNTLYCTKNVFQEDSERTLAGHSEYVSESTMSTVMFSVFFTCGEFLTYPHCYVYFIIIFLFCNQERIVSVNNFFQFTIFHCEKQTLFWTGETIFFLFCKHNFYLFEVRKYLTITSFFSTLM